MPIYEYRCSTCGFQKEYLQKISDPLQTVCPECGKATFAKMLTAAGFQLKGSGWYATDFKHSKPAANPAAKSDGKSEAKTEAKSDAKADGKSEAASAGKSEGKTETKSETAPAAAPVRPAHSS
jgi:putative FmdB family regulatory protein